MVKKDTCALRPLGFGLGWWGVGGGGGVRGLGVGGGRGGVVGEGLRV